MPDDQRCAARDLSRRGVLRGAAVGGVTLPLLAACGGGDSGSSSGSGGGNVTVAKGDVPVGGGTVLADAEVVVTQPTEGQFRAFSAICTHQGCPVNRVADGTIDCPCHGSKYSIEDGSVQAGPAPAPLPEKSVEEQGDELVIG